jgi:hypothetical protein
MADSDTAEQRGRAFEHADLTRARFADVDLRGARIEHSDLSGVVMRGVELADVSIDGEIENLVVNGVDVAPLVEAELDRRHPDRPAFRPTTAQGFREAWDLNERLWAATVQRAGALDPELLHESVDGEWSFIQTLRHLAFASESWVGRCILGDPKPWHPLSLPWDQMQPRDGVPHDRDARPSLDEALALRHEPLVGPGWPDEGETFTVRECLGVVLNEEWWHRRYAERDLAVLEDRG